MAVNWNCSGGLVRTTLR